MRTRSKRWATLAAGLLGLGGSLTPARAQVPIPFTPSLTTADAVQQAGFNSGPPPGMMPGMGGPGGMPGQGIMPRPGPGGPVPLLSDRQPPEAGPTSPFSITDDRMPNAFSCLQDPRVYGGDGWCFWVRGEYLHWNVSPGKLSTPLVTTTTSTATQKGALGQSDTINLVDAGDYKYQPLTGGRATVGFAPGQMPIEVSGFFLQRNQTLFSGGSTDATGQYLARPVNFSNIASANGIGTEDVEFVNIPTAAAGTIRVESKLSLWNVEANGFFHCWDSDTASVDCIVGYNHTSMQEKLTIANNIGAPALVNFGGQIGLPLGFSTSVLDSFQARNNFNGGTLGLRSGLAFWRFNLMTDLKLAMGNTNENIIVNGSSTLSPSAGAHGGQTLNGGILALPSNIGQEAKNRFSIIPQINANLSLQVTPNIRIFGGYSLMYWSAVARAGTAIPNTVDSRTIPTDVTFQPGFAGAIPGHPSIETRSFLADGYNFGLEIGF